MGGLGNRGAPKRSLLPSLGLTPPRHPAMHIDARTLPNGSVLEADLCIVGAGAAGISMALEWIGSRHKVLLLEGGGLDRSEEHTSELQSHSDLVCRLLLEKKKSTTTSQSGTRARRRRSAAMPPSPGTPR